MKLILTCALTPLLLTSVFADGAFYGDPPDATHPWAIHDRNRPQPLVIKGATASTQEKPGQPPSDAIVLFDGTEASLAKWCSDADPNQPTKWVLRDGAFECVPKAGYTRTKEEWGDCQLHVEWSAPAKAEGSSQGRGNSGIFPMGQVEVQVLDNYNNPTYPDGFAASVYGINPPLANALNAPGQWQTFDIIFRRPVFKDGKEVDPGYLTVFCNGVLVQDHTALEGGGGHRARSKSHPFPEKGPLKLQDHGNPVRYRNIWYRPLPARAIEGGEIGQLSPEATAAKRKEIAKSIRDKAAKMEGREKMLHLMESLCYETDPATAKAAEEMNVAALAAITKTPAAEMESKKGEVKQLADALNYLINAKAIPAPNATRDALDKIIKEKGWDK